MASVSATSRILYHLIEGYLARHGLFANPLLAFFLGCDTQTCKLLPQWGKKRFH
jgi:hypothetical protein